MEERENIRERLKKHKLSYVWLIGQLALRGIVTDKTEMSSVISGTRNGTKADAIIELSIDKSLFASDRVRVIEFNRHFTDEEQDKGLKDYFETPEAMRGIFTWLVAGYFKYIRFGLKMSQGMQKVIKQYEKDNDLVLQFLEEKCERNAEGKTRAKSLYDNYKMWCKGNGYYVCSMKKFNAELTAHPEWYADKAVTQGVLFYYGVALRQN